MLTDLRIIADLSEFIGRQLIAAKNLYIEKTNVGVYQINKDEQVIKLDMDYHELEIIPDMIFRLTHLESLSLRNNKITSIPAGISKLKRLRSLYLSNNKIQSISKGIDSSNLEELFIPHNRLSKLPSEISQFTKLKKLLISDNQLSTLPRSIALLKNLKEFDISRNRFIKFPTEIVNCLNLEKLDLSQNMISKIPPEICHFKNLSDLNLSDNRLTTLPDELSEIKKLQTLDMSKNRLTHLTKNFSKLTNLKILRLNHNRFSSLPQEIIKLRKIISLYLEKNQITQLPPEITLLTELKVLELFDNPIIKPPPEIALRYNNINRIRDYFTELVKQGEDYIYEAKLVLVGEPGAGKTSLAKKLIDFNYKLPAEWEMTRGIDIEMWRFPYSKGVTFQCNIWDFGGQEIMHATHRYFLTQRSLYILVADNRKEDCDFYYWLDILELLTGKSPVLIVNNEKYKYKKYVPEEIINSFDSIIDVFNIDLKSNKGLTDLTKEIQEHLRDLPHVGKNPLPKKWVQIRIDLEKDNRDYISLTEYFDLCLKYKIKDRHKALFISQFLHDLGVLLHFQDNLILENTLILNTKWATEAVYYVLLDSSIAAKGGKFDNSDLARVWGDAHYAEKQGELLQLMLKFELCYQIEQTESYIIPELLPDKPLNDKEYWGSGHLRDEGLIHFEYRYDFMPKGIISRLIVRMNRHIFMGQQWKSGVVLKIGDGNAEILEYFKDKKLKIRVTGSERLYALTIIRYELRKLHDTFGNLKYHEMVPCNCEECENRDEPHFFDFDELKQYKHEGEQFIKCRVGKIKSVDVLSLISDVRPKMENEIMSNLKKNIEGKGVDFSYTDNSTHFHEKVEKSNIALHSEKIKQNISRNENIDITLDKIIATLRKDDNLHFEQLMKFLEEVQALKQELSKEKPQKSIVERYLNNLGSVASIASLVNQISQYLPALL
ncbi:MAG: COR domain-containing protein [Candidatus Zixiibacteriota bacterium]